jgi:hypothetical protein
MSVEDRNRRENWHDIADSEAKIDGRSTFFHPSSLF